MEKFGSGINIPDSQHCISYGLPAQHTGRRHVCVHGESHRRRADYDCEGGVRSGVPAHPYGPRD
jgi:hypothetical protein